MLVLSFTRAVVRELRTTRPGAHPLATAFPETFDAFATRLLAEHATDERLDATWLRRADRACHRACQKRRPRSRPCACASCLRRRGPGPGGSARGFRRGAAARRTTAASPPSAIRLRRSMTTSEGGAERCFIDALEDGLARRATVTCAATTARAANLRERIDEVREALLDAASRATSRQTTRSRSLHTLGRFRGAAGSAAACSAATARCLCRDNATALLLSRRSTTSGRATIVCAGARPTGRSPDGSPPCSPDRRGCRGPSSTSGSQSSRISTFPAVPDDGSGLASAAAAGPASSRSGRPSHRGRERHQRRPGPVRALRRAGASAGHLVRPSRERTRVRRLRRRRVAAAGRGGRGARAARSLRRAQPRAQRLLHGGPRTKRERVVPKRGCTRPLHQARTQGLADVRDRDPGRRCPRRRSGRHRRLRWRTLRRSRSGSSRRPPGRPGVELEHLGEHDFGRGDSPVYAVVHEAGPIGVTGSRLGEALEAASAPRAPSGSPACASTTWRP